MWLQAVNVGHPHSLLTPLGDPVHLLLVWDADGKAWFVPGYVMRHGDDEWSWVSVVSLIERIIEIPEAMPIDIMPMPAPFIEE